MKKLILVIVFSLLCHVVQAGVVVDIPPPLQGDMSPESTRTFLWEAPNPLATLVFVQGGTGRLSLRSDQTNLGHPFYQMLKHLAETKNNNGKINVVVFDSPWSLGDVQYPIMRTSANHLKRIEDVVLFYKEKYKLPVWLMGHSNGGVSMASFLDYLQQIDKTSLISGMIFSNAHNNVTFKPSIDIPILYIQHKYDACSDTGARGNNSNFEKLKLINKSLTEYALISTGGSAGDCKSGAHMYAGSETDATAVIRSFILKNNSIKNKAK